MITTNNGWIRVRDSLPLCGESCLLINKEKEVCLGFFEDIRGEFYYNLRGIMVNNCETLYFLEKNYKLSYPKIINVTHWMPLQKLPD